MMAEDSEVRRLQAHKKTQLCKFFAVGACTRGSSCAFAHGSSQLREQPDFSKTRLCADFMERGRCDRGRACKFAHGKLELRPGSAAKIGRPNGRFATPEQESGASKPKEEDSQAVMQALETLRKRQLHHERATVNLMLQCAFAGAPFSSGPGKQGSDFDKQTSFSRQTTWEGVESSSAVFSRASSNSSSCPDPSPTRTALEDVRELPHLIGLEVRVKNTFIHVHEDDEDFEARSMSRTKSMPSLIAQ